MKPRLSVCIPAWNAERTLQRTLDSIFTQQGYSPETTEVVVVDDGSSDGTRPLLSKLEGTPGLRISFNPTNLGATANWERALRLGRGEIVTLLHSDDWWAPGLLKTVLEEFERTSALVLYASGQLYHRDDGVVENRNPEWREARWGAGEYLDELLTLRQCPAPSTTFFRADKLHGLTPLYDSRFRWCPERDLYVRLMVASAGGVVRHGPEALIRRGTRVEQQSVRYPGHAITDTCELFEVHRPMYDAHRSAGADAQARPLFTSSLLGVVLLRDWKQLADVAGNRSFRAWLSAPANAAAVSRALMSRSARRLLKALGLG